LADLDRAQVLANETLRLAHTVGDRHAFARGLEVRAQIAARQGGREVAVRLVAAASSMRESAGLPLSEREAAELHEWLREIQAALGAAAANALWVEGRHMTAEAAAHEGLQPDESSTQRISKPGTRPGGLTARELEVAKLVARGLSNREIADTLVISEPTVVRHMSNVLGKLSLKSRSQVAVWAVEQGIVVSARG
jgi:DNA-binding CsgD family transcriptional regulator